MFAATPPPAASVRSAPVAGFTIRGVQILLPPGEIAVRLSKMRSEKTCAARCIVARAVCPSVVAGSNSPPLLSNEKSRENETLASAVTPAQRTTPLTNHFPNGNVIESDPRRTTAASARRDAVGTMPGHILQPTGPFPVLLIWPAPEPTCHLKTEFRTDAPPGSIVTRQAARSVS